MELLAGRDERWLVTGAAGFIGSNIVEALLRGGQRVRAVDNFATGHRRNLDEVRRLVGAAADRLEFVEADIADPQACEAMVAGVDRVLHQAALGSVPRSIAEPIGSFRANVDGFVQLLDASRRAAVRRFVYASSSSVYGDSAELPKVEARCGRVLSPYAATKAADELFADVFARTYGIHCVGLRYFNVFGPRQDPAGAYAAVVPKWVDAMLHGRPVTINGDGKTSRDFCYVANAVQANLRAGLVETLPSPHEVYNVAVGEQTSLLELFALIRDSLTRIDASVAGCEPVFADFRAGDVRHSLADIGKAGRELGYQPTHTIATGMAEALDWYVGQARGSSAG
ncbi:MAG: SDR family oxidoreductase [Pseudomonadota bacterium]|jgi:UDP-N-acetylglucosamine 4-epimerase|nr:SDR family oxidoreductase [Pseudomonadota bacterium]